MPDVSYAPLIEGMTWSYSRLSTFEDCPYHWYLKYINPVGEEEPLFFSSYGSFIHELLADYYYGKADKLSLRIKYLTEFDDRVPSRAPSSSVFKSYLLSGVRCLDELKPAGEVLGVEQRADFKIAGHKFVGYIDLVEITHDNKLVISDHKSHALKARSGRKKPTRSDVELDEYLRQLYLYSNYVETAFGRRPDELRFNCFRTGELICEPFSERVRDNVNEWAAGLIERITDESEFHPNIEPFKCRYICEMHPRCEFYQIYKDGR